LKNLRSFLGLTTVGEIQRWLHEHATELDDKVDDLQSGRVDPPISSTRENRDSYMWRYFDQASVLRQLIREIEP
jgi:hypothetical protein